MRRAATAPPRLARPLPRRRLDRDCDPVRAAVALVDGLGTPPAAASGLAYAVAVLINYDLTRRWTFHGRAASWREFGRFVAASALGLALNVALFEAGLRLGLPHYLLAQAVATAVVTAVNFEVYRRWAFAR
jgi:putative flippase GtrA